MSAKAIRAALVQAVKDNFPGWAIAYENTLFDPPEDRWLKITLLPVSNGPVTLGPSGQDEEEGMLQIDINVPIKTSTGVVDETYETLRNIFEAGEIFTYNNQPVRIRRCERSVGRRYNARFYRVSATITWTARTNRTP